jgi:hypothetical protein
MRVPSSSLTLRSVAPVRTHRGSGFEPLISRAVRGGVWAAPSFHVCGRRGVWASQPSRCWLVAQRGMGTCGACFTSSRPWRPSHARALFRGLMLSRAGGSCRSRVLRGMGTRGACFTSSRSRVPSHVDIPSRAVFVLSHGFEPLEGFAWHGYPRCLLYIKQVPGTFSRRYPIEGCPCLGPRVRPARGFSLLGKGPDHLMPRSRGCGFCSAGASF